MEKETKFARRAKARPVMRRVLTRRVEDQRGKEALRASEEKYRQLFELESDALFMIDKETTEIKEANKAAVLLYGYTYEELLAMNALELSAEPDKARQTISDTSGIVPFRYHCKKDGTTFPVEITFTDFVHLGHPMQMTAVRDLTERKRAEEALNQASEKTYQEFTAKTRISNEVVVRQSEEKYAALFKNAAVPAALTKIPAGVFVDVNEAFETTFGYTRQEVIGKTSIEIGMARPEERARAYVNLEQHGSVQDSEMRVRTKSGEVRDCLIHVNQVQIGAEDFVITTIHDITERKRMEEEIKAHRQHLEELVQERTNALQAEIAERKQAEELLRKSEIRYRVLFESVPIGITLADTNGQIIDSNPATIRILGLSAEEQEQRKVDGTEWRIIRPDGTLMPQDEYASVRALKEQKLIQNVEMGVTRGKEDVAWISVNAAPVPGVGVVTSYVEYTERKQAEVALRKSEEIYRTLAEHTEDVIARFDRNYRHLYANSAAFSVTGITPTEYLGKTHREVGFPPEQCEIAETALESVFTTGRPVHKAIEYESPMGRVYLDWRMYPEFDAAGNVMSVLLNVHNLTERRQAEEKLRESEARFRTLSESALTGIYIIQESQLVYVNPALAKMFGYEPSELIGADPLLFVHPDDRVLVIEGMRRRLADNVALTMEYRGVCKNSEIKNIMVIGARANFNNRPAVIGNIIDITERKRVEEALQKSEIRYRVLFETVPTGITLADTNGQIIESNPAAIRILGLSAEEHERRKIDGTEWRVMRPDGMPMPPDEYASVRALKEQKLIQNVEMGVTRSKEDVAWISVNAAPVPGVGVVISYVEYTERKQAEEALRESEDQFKHIFDHSIIGKSITKLSGEVLVNRAFSEALGYAHDEFKKYKWQEITHPEDIELTQREIDALLSGKKKSVRFEKRFIHKNGSIIWVDLSSTLRRDKDGNPLYLVTDLVDITERKRAETDLLQANKALMKLHEMLREQAAHDALTGLHNRRYLYETVERELARAKREKYPVSVVMIDIDHFKNFNDTHGHQAGDEILIALGNLLQHSVRQGDVACRYGGEEFILVLPGAQLEDAQRRAETIRRDFENLQIQFNEDLLSSTVSVGVASSPEHGDDTNLIIKAADLALYQAKEDGRNCVRIAVV